MFHDAPPVTGVGPTPHLRAWGPAVGTIALLVAAAFAASDEPPSATRVALLAALSFIPYAGLFIRGRVPPAGTWRGLPLLPLVAATLAGLALAWAPPALSDDVFRYLWDGRVTRAGIDPYRFSPDDPALAAIRDDAWARINHPRIPTIYPPLAQGVFAAADVIAHQPQVFQLLALAIHLATVVVLHRGLADRSQRDRTTWLLALQPLMLLEGAGNGHLDGAVGLLLLTIVLALARDRSGPAALATVAASGMKLVGLLAVPLLWRRSRGAALAALVFSFAATAPLLFAGRGSREAGGLHHYATRWRGPDGVYGLLHGAVTKLADPLLGPGGDLSVDRATSRLAPLSGGRLDPLAPFRREKKARPAIPEDVFAGLVARTLAVSAALAIVVVVGGRRDSPLADGHALRTGLLVGLLLAPQVHPWYLLWLLPLEHALNGRAGLVWSAVVLGSYAGADAWARDRIGVEMGAWPAVSAVLVLATLSLELARPYLPGVSRRPTRRMVPPSQGGTCPNASQAALGPPE